MMNAVRKSRGLRQTLLAFALSALLLLGAAAVGPCGSAYAAQAQVVPLLMIVVEFDGGETGQDASYSQEDDWARVLFRGDDSLAAFCRAMSDDAFSYAPVVETSASGVQGNHSKNDRADDGIVHVTLHQGWRPWGLVNEDPAVVDDFTLVVAEAFERAGDFVDLPGYDINGDGVIMPDELVVALCIPAYDASTMADPGRADIPVVWPHAGKISNQSAAYAGYDGLMVDSYIAIAEQLWSESDEAQPIREPAGILFHELGHYLGLPDLYPLNSDAERQAWGAYRVGALSLMDSGGWARTGEDDGFAYKPTSLDVWSRYVLGWNTPQVVTESGDYVVSSQNAEGGYHALLVPSTDPDQYFLVENREPEGFDSSLETEYGQSASRGGIVVWRIDKGIYRRFGEDNHLNNTDHRPGVMPVFFETYGSGGSYSLEWQRSEPDTGEPFFAGASLVQNLGNADVVVNLPLAKGGSDDDAPSDRVNSGVILGVPADRARSMTVHIDLTNSEVVPPSGEYEAVSPGQELRESADGLAQVACAALLRETDATVALVSSSDIQAGIAGRSVSLADAYAVLPSDSTIQLYEATGEQLLLLLEGTLEHRYRLATGFGESGSDTQAVAAGQNQAETELFFGGITCVVDWSQPVGKRLRDARVETGSIQEGQRYRVAATSSVADAYGLARRFSPNTLVVFGSPADAMRSLLQCDAWEDRASQLAGMLSYVAPREAGQSAMPGIGLPNVNFLAIGLAVALAGFVLMVVAALRIVFLVRR